MDGQPVETGSIGKKNKPGKVVSTEVVRVPYPAEGPEQHSLSFDFSTDEPTSRAQRKLTKALRNPSLNQEQRQQMQHEMAKLQQRMQTYQAELGQQNQHFQFDFDRDTSRRTARSEPRFSIKNGRMKVYPGTVTADRAADATERNAAQAARNATQAARNAEQLEINIRRAELRARMAADAAELRALAGAGPEAIVYNGPTIPQPPQAPQVVLPPTPPAPKTAELRAALRQDGLIGKNDRSFSFSLNDKGGSVNGQALTPAQVARYRQLLDQPVSSKGKTSTFSISVNEN